MKAYARLNDATAALDLLAEFQQEGGRPDERMISMGVTACVRAGEFRRALKVSSDSAGNCKDHFATAAAVF